MTTVFTVHTEHGHDFDILTAVATLPAAYAAYRAQVNKQEPHTEQWICRWVDGQATVIVRSWCYPTVTPKQLRRWARLERQSERYEARERRRALEAWDRDAWSLINNEQSDT